MSKFFLFATVCIQLLVQAGFVISRGNSYHQADVSLDTGDAFSEPIIINNHEQTLRTWAGYISQTSKENRELGLLNIPINSSKIPELKERIQNFQDEIIGWIQDEQDADQIVQLGTYLIPITKNT